uniref:Splicing factor YJU2 n=1 Tax=Rhabditophanes sp. KR3021 TaxID=114890 RepID=A0AC35TH30_9BILA
MTGTERKTFQKYYPPDFDSNKLPKIKNKRANFFIQRVMTPYNMQCNACKEYIYQGKKFNMKRETVQGETYLGLALFRFTFKCPNCLAEIKFKTDLENCNYEAESGATRLFEAYKLFQDQKKAAEEKEEADAADPMKMLEKRIQASRNEMEAVNKLEELKEVNRRNMMLDVGEIVRTKQMNVNEELSRQEKEDDEEAKRMFEKPSTSTVFIAEEIIEEVIEEELKPEVILEPGLDKSVGPKRKREPSAQAKLLKGIIKKAKNPS